ncbi:MAG TPA: VOC family protein [Candidatus Sulfopaludibacter sp.]|jgi:catechol 2,3-dioxygenase-like lactoylglutathione lyase family enzyme|nr:VOC family protein [Candidatus Sulfopaludibacter sp.]
MTQARINAISPCFIVGNVRQTIAFYCGKLGFVADYLEPEDDPFFAGVYRDGAMIFVKSHEGLAPTPNSSRHAWMKWDAYVSVPDPDALAAEFAANGLTFHTPLGVTSENLRGFEVRDPDGYVLFFGRPN